MNADLRLLLDGIPALANLPPAAHQELGRVLTRRTAVRGEYLFQQGAGPPPNVYYLISATVEVLVGGPEQELAVSVSGAGQLVGWLTVFTQDPFPASARVAAAGEVLQIPAVVLRGLMDRYPEVGQILAATMARRLEDLFEEIREQQQQRPLTRADTFPFRKRVREVMAGRVLSLPPSAPARAAAQAMRAAATGSVVVSEDHVPRGIVTERDLVQRLLAEGRDPDQTPLWEVMSTPVAALTSDSYVYKALGVMRRLGVRHLPVVDAERLVGVISMRAIVNLGSNEALELVDQIEGSRDLAGLAAARSQGHHLCAHLIEAGVPAEEVSALLSQVNRDLHRQTLELTLSALEAEGRGRPPLAFCLILMGSHGRGENHLNTDQDHGMILADYPPAEWSRVEPYFMELGQRFSDNLAEVGFARCRGHVMSANPVWRKPMREWRAQVQGWYREPTSNAVRYTTLFYDFLPVWGELSLARQLRAEITAGIQENHQLLRSLFEEASHHKVPLTWLKRFVIEKSGPHKGMLDLKRSGLLFVVECARILALRHGIEETATLARLQALRERGAIPAEEAEFIRTAYKTLFHFLLNTQVRQLQADEPVSNYINPQDLPIQESYMLRHALEATGRLQGLVHASFGNIFF